MRDCASLQVFGYLRSISERPRLLRLSFLPEVSRQSHLVDLATNRFWKPLLEKSSFVMH
jgi:hypothetical protein